MPTPTKPAPPPAMQPGSEPLLLFLLETKKAKLASKPRKRAAPTTRSTVEQNPTKRPKLESMQRFSTASEAQLTKVSKPFFPKKTEDATAWSLRTFHCWLNNRNSQDQLEKCPQNLLEEMDSKKLNYWLALFLVETRKVTGESHCNSFICSSHELPQLPSEHQPIQSWVHRQQWSFSLPLVIMLLDCNHLALIFVITVIVNHNKLLML